MAGFSILTGAIYQIAFAMGMARTTAGNTALIMSSIPMWTAIISVTFVRERLGRLAWVGLTVTFVGTAIVTLQKVGVTVTTGNVVGNFIVLFAALAWAVGSVISRPILRFVSPIKLAFLATLGTLPIHFLAARASLNPESITAIEWSTWFCILYSGIFSTGLAYAMWNYGVQQLGASHAAVFQNLVPLVALACSWLVLGEVVTTVQAIGGMMIIIGLIVVRRNRQKKIARPLGSGVVANPDAFADQESSGKS
jgi:drug/metabolite transporter (DMT)-like permease